MNRFFDGVMGSGVRHFGLYAVFGAKYQYEDIESNCMATSCCNLRE